MTRRPTRTTVEPSHSSVLENAGPCPEPAVDLSAMTRALVATGLFVGDALEEIKGQLGKSTWEKALPTLHSFLVEAVLDYKNHWDDFEDGFRFLCDAVGEKAMGQAIGAANGLTVEESMELTFTNPFALTRLPDNLRVDGTLALDGCPNLHGLGSNTRVDGELILKKVGDPFTIPGDLSMNALWCGNEGRVVWNPGAKEITSVKVRYASLEWPESLKKAEEVSLFNTLTALPGGLTIEHLELCSVQALRTLPLNLKVDNLEITDCETLRSFSTSSKKPPERLEIRRCPNWDGILPEPWVQGWRKKPSVFLNFENVPLKQLPDGLRADTLRLTELKAFRELPRTGEFGTIEIRSCPRWDFCIRDTLKVKGQIHVSLPDSPDSKRPSANIDFELWQKIAKSGKIKEDP